MFIDILMDKVDTMRVHLLPKDIVNIEYGLYGLPHIVVKMLALMVQEPIDRFALLKAEHIY